MSNKETSKLYEAVIEEVINDSRQDFENSGIDESTLQELKRVWQEKLTQSLVARFSWDDEFQQNNLQGISQTGGLQDETKPVIQDDLLLSNPYGLSADQQLSYNNINTGGVNQNDIGLQIPNIDNSQGLRDDYEDNGGLMLPSVTQSDGALQPFEMTIYSKNPKKVFEQLKKINQVDGELGKASDDDDNLFNDSDDINSELDDDLVSDKSDDEDNELDGQIMLCLYDKVQRIKNKWKCSLKEGIASINGKDYVFQKSTGECEW